MVRKCCACFKGCGPGEKITLHKFPKDVLIRKKWVKAIERKNFVPSNTSVLCSRHFTPECFTYGKSGMQKRVFIKPNAVPTLFPPITQSRRSLMRSSLPPPHIIDCSDNDHRPSQSISPDEYTKQDSGASNDPNTSEAVSLIESTDHVLDIEHVNMKGGSPIDWVEHFDQSDNSLASTKEHNSSMDWSEHCDQSNDSIMRCKRDLLSESCAEEGKEYNDSDDVHEFKSRRRAPRNMNQALSCIAAQRRELKIVKQKNRLLEKRLSILKTLLTHVLNGKDLPEDDNDSDSDSEFEIWSG
ncbi:uncharacterized protein LOC105693089 [Athalia rosae]|uniref:uncharacterized protein LOC105693089 n=1 Tax=Athalia rosae TaxID=37344 RepID=UPI000625B4C6|nr:uncharacterized protein LOC105693089 [Athalia rosae]